MAAGAASVWTTLYAADISVTLLVWNDRADEETIGRDRVVVPGRPEERVRVGRDSKVRGREGRAARSIEEPKTSEGRVVLESVRDPPSSAL